MKRPAGQGGRILNFQDTVICDYIVNVLETARARGQTVIVNNDGEFVRSLNLEASITNRARVFGKMVDTGMICRSRPRPEGIFEGERPITLWLPSQPTPLNVLAYRR